MQTEIYKITCKKCKHSDTVVIDNQHNIYWKAVKYIISGRYRLDMIWGWQCVCGNNDLVSNQEKKEIRNLQAPDPQDISNVLKSLIPDKPKFEMKAV